MLEAYKQAQIAYDRGEVPVGAVVVSNNRIIARAHNQVELLQDPTAHAEILAITAAAEALGSKYLENCELYVTLEPCVMCVGAIAQARISRVVFGAYDRKAGALGSVEDLSDSRALNHRFEVNGGLLAEECSAPLKTFFSAKR